MMETRQTEPWTEWLLLNPMKILKRKMTTQALKLLASDSLQTVVHQAGLK